MEEQFVEFCSPKFETVVVILDASESAEQHWPIIADFAKKIFQKIPAGIEKKLFFLSNPQEYDIENFEENVGSWRKKNKKKGSFISPILNQIQKATIVVIGSGIIYDLEDWKRNPLSQNIVFIYIGNSMRGNVEMGKEVVKDDFDGHLLQLYNRILSVKITGLDFLPYYWDNPGYSFNDEDGISLISSNLENYSIKIAAYGKNITATMEKVQEQEKISLSHVGTHNPDIIQIIEHNSIKWENLEKNEMETFRNHITSEIITCPDPSCGREITGSLKCDNPKHGKLLGFPIYPSLKSYKGFIIFKENSQGVFFKPYPSEIVKIDEGKVARSKKSKATVIHYEPHIRKWVERGDLKPYYPLKGGYYVSLI